MPHRLVARRIALSNSRYDILLDHVEGPQGAVPDFVMVRPKVQAADMVTGVCVLPVVEGRIGLMRVSRPHFPEPLWVAPSGFLEPDEPVEISAVRELEEETGLTCDPGDLLPLGLLLLDPGVLEARIALFAATRARRRSGPLPGAGRDEAGHELGAGRLVLFEPEQAEELALTSPSMDGGTVAACLRWAVRRRQEAEKRAATQAG